MKTNTSHKKILVILGLLVLGLFVALALLFASIKGKNENVANLKNELQSQINRQQYMVSMDKMVEGADSDITLINNSIVPADGDVKFIEDLEALAQSNGLSLEIEALVFEDNKFISSTTMKVLKVQANTKGDWSGTYTFLAQIESLPFRVRVNKFTFTSSLGDGSKKSGSVVWQSKFEIIVLKYK